MSFSEEVGQFFALTEPQSAQLEAGLIALEQAFQQAESDVVNTPEFASRFYQKFQQLAAQNGLSEADIEPLVNVLYFTEDHQQAVTYIVPSFYNSGGDREVFSDTYQLMMEDLQQSL